MSASFHGVSCCCSHENIGEIGWNFNYRALSLVSQRCILRNTAGLLDFMLHSLLSISSMKTVCCHNATPHTLRSKLISGSFQFYIWRLNLEQAPSFISPLQNKLVLRCWQKTSSFIQKLKTTKNFRLRKKSFETSLILKWNFLIRQIFKQKFYNASDFGLKKLKRVRFWIRSFLTCQIFKNC